MARARLPAPGRFCVDVRALTRRRNPSRQLCVKLAIQNVAESFAGRRVCDREYRVPHLLRRARKRGASLHAATRSDGVWVAGASLTRVPLKCLSLTPRDALDVVKTQLLAGRAVAVGIRKHVNCPTRGVYKQYSAAAEERDSREGQHAFCVVGWDDALQFPNDKEGTVSEGGLIFLDNCGPKWGHRGFGFASYASLGDAKHGIDEVLFVDAQSTPVEPLEITPPPLTGPCSSCPCSFCTNPDLGLDPDEE